MLVDELETKQFCHRPDRIEAVKITTENKDAVVRWVNGWLTTARDKEVIVWHQANGHSVYSSGASIGQWLCRSEKNPDIFFTLTEKELANYEVDG